MNQISKIILKNIAIFFLNYYNKFHIFVQMKSFSSYNTIFILLCLVFFLLPNTGYSCAKKIEITKQSSCLNEKAKQKENCKLKSDKKSDDNQCNDKCKDSLCKCHRSTLPSLNLPPFILSKMENIIVRIEKRKFGFKQIQYSSDFSSIWQPPKISQYNG